MANGWASPYSDNILKLHKIGNMYVIKGIVKAPSEITEATKIIATFSDIGASGQSTCALPVYNTNKPMYINLFSTSLQDQYLQAVPNADYTVQYIFYK